MSTKLSPARIAAIAVGMVIVGLLGLLTFGVNRDEASLVGEPAPPIVASTIDGESFDLADSQGKWVVLNFFATWCPGCITEHPDLIEIDRWGAETGQLEVVAVVFNDSPDQVRTFFSTQGGEWPVIVGPSIADDYAVSNIPETFLISPTGKVSLHIQGEVDGQKLIALIEQAAG